MGLRNHLEKRIHKRLVANYTAGVTLLVKQDAQLRQEGRLPEPSAETLTPAIRHIHQVAWGGALMEVDPRGELPHSIGREKLDEWQIDAAADFFSDNLGMSRTEAIVLVFNARVVQQ